jgi:multisubunit Na+/H+ antiporter MnhB subunit
MELIQAPFATWLTYELANSVMMAWLYNSTGGSLPIAWAAHVGLSLGQNLVNAHPIPFGWFVTTFLVVAGIIVIVSGPRTLARSTRLRAGRESGAQTST